MPSLEMPFLVLLACTLTFFVTTTVFLVLYIVAKKSAIEKQALADREIDELKQAVYGAEDLAEKVQKQLVDANDLAQLTQADLRTQLQVSEMRLQEQQQHHDAMNQELKSSQQKLQQDFEALSRKIFEDNRKRFENESKRTLEVSLSPLKKEIEGFRQRVEQTHKADLQDRNRLQGQMIELQKQAQQIGQDAIQLANALKGESKSQGNWGEMILERLLEDSGLERGREYQVQASYIDEEGRRKQPDVVIKLPEGRDIIIDSKVSLVAYERFFNAATEEQRAAALKDHLSSMRNHFSGLSHKKYDDLEGVNSLDFVFMFVPVEPAYILTLQSATDLFQQAYDKGVVMVSPTTLMATLRTVSNIWRYEKQNMNAQKIADDAGGLYDQFVLLVESLDQLGKRLEDTQKSYQQARNRLSEGRGNVVRRIENIKKLGVKSKKQLPDSIKGLLDG